MKLKMSSNISDKLLSLKQICVKYSRTTLSQRRKLLADQTHCQQEGAQRRNNSHSLMHLKHFLGVCESPMCCWLLCPCCHMGFLWLSAAPGWLQLRYYFQKIKTMSRTSLISFLELSKAAVREVSRYKPPLLTLHIGTGTIIDIKTFLCVLR